MCAVCLSNPCHPACPNAEEPDPVFTCIRCGGGIFAGDNYFDSPDGSICKECVDDMSAGEMLEVLGEKLETAEKEGV